MEFSFDKSCVSLFSAIKPMVLSRPEDIIKKCKALTEAIKTPRINLVEELEKYDEKVKSIKDELDDDAENETIVQMPQEPPRPSRPVVKERPNILRNRKPYRPKPRSSSSDSNSSLSSSSSLTSLRQSSVPSADTISIPSVSQSDRITQASIQQAQQLHHTSKRNQSLAQGSQYVTQAVQKIASRERAKLTQKSDKKDSELLGESPHLVLDLSPESETVIAETINTTKKKQNPPASNKAKPKSRTTSSTNPSIDDNASNFPILMPVSADKPFAASPDDIVLPAGDGYVVFKPMGSVDKKYCTFESSGLVKAVIDSDKLLNKDALDSVPKVGGPIKINPLLSSDSMPIRRKPVILSNPLPTVKVTSELTANTVSLLSSASRMKKPIISSVSGNNTTNRGMLMVPGLSGISLSQTRDLAPVLTSVKGEPELSATQGQHVSHSAGVILRNMLEPTQGINAPLMSITSENPRVTSPLSHPFASSNMVRLKRKIIKKEDCNNLKTPIVVNADGSIQENLISEHLYTALPNTRIKSEPGDIDQHTEHPSDGANPHGLKVITKIRRLDLKGNLKSHAYLFSKDDAQRLKLRMLTIKLKRIDYLLPQDVVKSMREIRVKNAVTQYLLKKSRKKVECLQPTPSYGVCVPGVSVPEEFKKPQLTLTKVLNKGILPPRKRKKVVKTVNKIAPQKVPIIASRTPRNLTVPLPARVEGTEIKSYTSRLYSVKPKTNPATDNTIEESGLNENPKANDSAIDLKPDLVYQGTNPDLAATGKSDVEMEANSGSSCKIDSKDHKEIFNELLCVDETKEDNKYSVGIVYVQDFLEDRKDDESTTRLQGGREDNNDAVGITSLQDGLEGSCHGLGISEVPDGLGPELTVNKDTFVMSDDSKDDLGFTIMLAQNDDDSDNDREDDTTELGFSSIPEGNKDELGFSGVPEGNTELGFIGMPEVSDSDVSFKNISDDGLSVNSESVQNVTDVVDGNNMVMVDEAGNLIRVTTSEVPEIDNDNT